MFSRCLITAGILCMFVLSNGVGVPEARAQELVVLENGLQVLIQEDERFPLVSMRLYVHAGSAYEKPGQAGISHLLEHMVFKGTEKRDAGEIAEDVEKVGGKINAATSFDHTMYKVDLPAKNWSLGFDVLKDMIFGSNLDAGELKSEKSVVMSELERGEDNPGRLLFKSIQKNVWKELPYARPIIGYPETVKELSSQDLKNYIDRLYQPQSMLLVVCGDVQKEEVLRKVRQYFGGLQNDHTVIPPRSGDPIDQKAPRIDIRTGPWKKAYLGISFPLPALSSPRSADLEVLAHMLGGDKSSYLYRKYKYRKQLVDQISCSALMLERGGMLYIRVVLPPDSIDPFWKSFASDMASLTVDSFSEEMLDRAKVNIEDELFSSKETLGGLASKLGYFQFFEHSTRAEDKYIYELRHVDREKVQSSIDRYLGPQHLNAAVLLPESVQVDRGTFRETLLHNWSSKETANKTVSRGRSLEKEREVLDLGQDQTLVILEDSSLPYTALNISWPGGDKMLGKNEAGLAELTAGSLTRGTSNKTTTEIQDFLSQRAADLDAGSSRDSFSVQAKFPVRYSKDMYGLVREILFHPQFAPEEVQKAIREQIAEIQSRDDRPQGFMFRRLFPFLFSQGPLNMFHLGQVSELKKMDATDVRSFWQDQLSRPCVITVCGQIERDPLDKLVRKIREKEVRVSPNEKESHWGEKREQTYKLDDRNQAHAMLVFPVPGLKNEDTPALKVLKTVLAGQGGILFRELRDEKGLGYSVTSFLWQTPKKGFLAFYIGIYPEKEKQAVEGFKRIIRRLRTDSLGEEKIERAENMISAGYYRNHQTLDSRSSEAASLLTMGLGLDFKKKMIERVKEVDAEELREVAQKYLRMDKSYFMDVLPE